MTNRKLIVLCDGTFNDPSDNTNVFKFKNALARENQLVFYDEGVGITEEGGRRGTIGRLFESLAGGAFGYGLSTNVQQGYRWVCQNYQAGDDLYFLGFSRGAFTARSVVGMIRKIGLIRPPVDRFSLREAFDRYRDQHHPNCPETEDYRERLNTLRIEELSLRFLGVWDTVGALGVPVVGLRSFVAAHRWQFHDTRLSSHVRTARQALAVDERRAAFLPAPWCSEDGEPKNDVKQVWFAGCHSDVGGRNGQIAFDWMLAQAEDNGLKFKPRREDRNPPEAIQTWHNSLSRFWSVSTGSVDRAIIEQLPSPEVGTRFRDESVSTTAEQLCAGLCDTDEPDLVPQEDRESLRLRGTMSTPKRGRGLTLGYYLAQYRGICADRPHCCQRYTRLGE